MTADVAVISYHTESEDSGAGAAAVEDLGAPPARFRVHGHISTSAHLLIIPSNLVWIKSGVGGLAVNVERAPSN